MQWGQPPVPWRLSSTKRPRRGNNRRQRFAARSPAEQVVLAERSFRDESTKAYEDAISATTTKKAAWFIVPADHKWVARTAVAVVVAHAIHSLDLSYPKPTQEQLEAIERARAELERE